MLVSKTHVGLSPLPSRDLRLNFEDIKSDSLHVLKVNSHVFLDRPLSLLMTSRSGVATSLMGFSPSIHLLLFDKRFSDRPEPTVVRCRSLDTTGTYQN